MLVGYRRIFGKTIARQSVAFAAIGPTVFIHTTIVHLADGVTRIFKPIRFAPYLSATATSRGEKAAFGAYRAARRRLIKFVLPKPPRTFCRIGSVGIYEINYGAVQIQLTAIHGFVAHGAFFRV